MIIGSLFPVYIVAHRIDSVKPVMSNTSLEATTRLLPHGTEHFYLFHQVIVAVMDVSKAVNLFPGKMGGCRYQLFEFRCLSHLISHCRRIHMGNKGRVVNHTLDFLSHVVDFRLQLSQAFPILFPGHHTHSCIPPRCFALGHVGIRKTVGRCRQAIGFVCPDIHTLFYIKGSLGTRRKRSKSSRISILSKTLDTPGAEGCCQKGLVISKRG